LVSTGSIFKCSKTCQRRSSYGTRSYNKSKDLDNIKNRTNDETINRINRMNRIKWKSKQSLKVNLLYVSDKIDSIVICN